MEMNRIPTALTLDDIASYFNGKKALEDYSPDAQAFLKGVEGGRMDLDAAEYPLTQPLTISAPLVLEGHGAKLVGPKEGIGIRVTCGDVTVRDLSLEDFGLAMDLDPAGTLMENVLVENVAVKMLENGFQFGSSHSGSVMRHIRFRGCDVTGADGWVENELALSLPFNGCAAKERLTCPGSVCDCLLEDVWLEHNTVHGGLRVGVNFASAMPDMADPMNPSGLRSGNTIRGLHLIGNKIDECWDGPFNIVGCMAGASDGLIDGVEIAENDVGFGIAGVYMYANEPIIGSSAGSAIRNVVIRDNTFTRVVADVGEPTRGLFIAPARVDYYPGAEVHGAVLENLDIYGNTLTGAGIVLCGAYSLLDGESLCEGNVLRNVHIHDNHIIDADYAFIFEAAQMEGRRYDWNFGYPRHDKKWMDPIEDDTVVTSRMNDNHIEDVLCENNRIDGYRYRIVAAGADIRGHGLASGNKFCKNIVMRNNVYGVGEAHVRVAGYIGEDFCRDGGGNEVDQDLRNR